MKNKISVAMAVYNGELYVEEQISSILNSINEEDELVISVQGSSDRSLAIIQKKAAMDSRVRIVQCSTEGVVSNFENAIKNCRNNIILLSDQDDVWVACKANIMRKQFDQSSVSVVIHDVMLTDDKLNVTHDSMFKFRSAKTNLMGNIIRPSYIGCAMGFRKELIKVILPFPKMKRSHDLWIGSISSFFGDMIFLDDKLILHRLHSSNFTSVSRRNVFKKVGFKVFIFLRIILRILRFNKFISVYKNRNEA